MSVERKVQVDHYTQSYIFQYYPPAKQMSDDADWLTYTTQLITHNPSTLTIDKIGNLVYEACARIMEKQSTYQDELNNLVQQYGNEQAWDQLLKVGLRKGWVRLIKQIAKQIYEDTTIPDTQLYYAINEKFFPLYEEAR